MSFLIKTDKNSIYFKNRSNKFYRMNNDGSLTLEEEIPIPDGIVLCDFCNRNITDEEIYLHCTIDHVLEAICGACKNKYYPNKFIMV